VRAKYSGGMRIKYEILRPISLRITWIFIAFFILCMILFVFVTTKDNLNSTRQFLNYGMFPFFILFSLVILYSQIISIYIEVKKDGVLIREEIKKKFIPYKDLKKVVIDETHDNRLHKIVSKNDIIYLNREIKDIEKFTIDLKEYIEIKS
jgi:hypothetical protein